MRFPLKKFLLTVSAICLLGLLSIGGILKPALNSKEDSDGTANSDPEAMQQKSLRMPLVVTGIGLQEQAEHNVTTTNFTEKHGEQFISLFCFCRYLFVLLCTFL